MASGRIWQVGSSSSPFARLYALATSTRLISLRYFRAPAIASTCRYQPRGSALPETSSALPFAVFSRLVLRPQGQKWAPTDIMARYTRSPGFLLQLPYPDGKISRLDVEEGLVSLKAALVSEASRASRKRKPLATCTRAKGVPNCLQVQGRAYSDLGDGLFSSPFKPSSLQVRPSLVWARRMYAGFVILKLDVSRSSPPPSLSLSYSSLIPSSPAMSDSASSKLKDPEQPAEAKIYSASILSSDENRFASTSIDHRKLEKYHVNLIAIGGTVGE